MKMKLAEIGLGFLSLVLLAQILWFTHGLVTAEGTPSFLWQRAGSTLALAIGVTLLWRATVPQQQTTPLQSLVLLLRSPRHLTAEQVQHVVETALGIPCDKDNPQSLNCIADTPQTFRIQADGYSFRVNNSTSLYITQTENTPENIPNVRLQQMVREHVAWLSVDLVDAPAQATSNDIYQRLGRIIATFAEDDSVGLCCPETNQLNIWHPILIEHLHSIQPLRAVAELVDVPAVRIMTDNPQMKAAEKKAQAMWSVFIDAFNHRHPEQTFAIKVPFTDGQETEYMWLIVTELSDAKVTGTLDNDPIYLRNIGAGDTVTIAIDQINDWLYTNEGKLVGGFTTEAFTEQMAA